MISEFFKLNILPNTLDSEKAFLTIHIITAAIIVFVKYWKEPRTPQIEELIGKIIETAEMDILSDWMNAKKKKVHWETWLSLYTVHGYRAERMIG